MRKSFFRNRLLILLMLISASQGRAIGDKAKNKQHFEIQSTVRPITSDSSFITTWKTDNPGLSDSTSITIPVHPNAEYNYDVDWDNDGIYDELGIRGSVTHDFGLPGTYTIRIKGDFNHLYFKDADDPEKLVDVVQWGNIPWNSLRQGFNGCRNLNISATDAPDLSRVKSLQHLFFGCNSFNSPIEHWDVSNIEDLYFTFGNCHNFNQPLNEWDVSKVESFQRTFIECNAFNQPLDKWDTSSARTMSAMFTGCDVFNQPIGNWATDSVEHMSLMFSKASSFNQDIGDWNTQSVTKLFSMFHHATSFNQDIGNWDVSRVNRFDGMFHQARAFNQNLNNWDTGMATRMEWMFAAAVMYNQPMDRWNVSQVENMNWMFFQAHSFNQDINTWDVGNVVSMQNMFKGRLMNFNQDISDWDVGKVEDMNAMFEQNTAFDQNLGPWDVSQVRSMDRMFNLTGLSTPNYDSLLIGWNTRGLQDSVNFHAGNSIYCLGWEARANMIASSKWSITDGGAERVSPIAQCKDTVLYLNSDGTLIIPPSVLDAGSYDDCTELLLFASKTEFSCTDIGITQDTLTVQDQNGNESTCTASLTIRDVPFVLNCPEDITVHANANGCGAYVNYDMPESNCSHTISSTHPSGSLFPMGRTLVVVTSTYVDGSQTTCNFQVSVINNLEIIIDSLVQPDCLDNPNGRAFISVRGGSAPFSFDWTFDGTGDQDEEDQGNLGHGTHQVYVRDHNGCLASNTIYLTTTGTQIDLCPENQVITAHTFDCSGRAFWDSPLEICSGNLLYANHNSGDTFPLGSTLVEYRLASTPSAEPLCAFEIEVINELELNAEEIIHPSCHHAEDGALEIKTKGGQMPYTLIHSEDTMVSGIDRFSYENLHAGTWFFMALDGNGCSVSKHFTLIPPDSMALNIFIADSTDEETWLDAEISGGTFPYQYDWDIDEIGDFDDDKRITVSQDGSYTLTVKDQNGCMADYTMILTTPASLCDDAALKVYPNPSYGFLELELGNCETVSSVEVVDIWGRILYLAAHTDTKYSLDLDYFASGTYYLRIHTDKEIYLTPFTITKQ